MTRVALLLALATLLAAGGSASAQGGAAFFRSPSGAIACGYVPLGANTEIRCEVTGGVKPLPPRPASCDLDWGSGYSMPRSGAARVVCAGDTVRDPNARVLAYGTTKRFGVFTCSSSTAGIRCTNASGHGFFMSRERSYKLTVKTPMAFWTSPTKNIMCVYGGGTPPTPYIRCDILSGLKPPPPGGASCEFDWGLSIGLGPIGKSKPLCVSDAATGPGARVLQYGEVFKRGPFRCDSLKAGMKCTNATGNGFQIARGFWNTW